MKVIEQVYLINASLKDVWEALTNPEKIDAWGGGPAKIQSKKGFKFEFWGGDITGENTEVVPLKRLVQNWKEKDWKNFSQVTFTLSSKNNKTEVKLIHKGVPEEELHNINEGWKDYYLGPLKSYLEDA